MLSVDDFMICAVELYTNILQLFTCILVLLTAKRNRWWFVYLDILMVNSVLSIILFYIIH